MEITPSTAREWLETSRGNPRWKGKKMVDKLRVATISDDIKNGNWNPGNNSIAFDENGFLVDGHHRLSAIIASGIPVSSLVVFGLSDLSVQHIDENRPRTVSQRIDVDNQIVAAANMHFWILNTLTKSSETSENIKKWIGDHPAVFDALSICRKGAGTSICKRSYVVHAVMCAIEYGVSELKLVDFANAVNSGFADIETGSAAIVCRNMLLKNSPAMRTRGNKVRMDFCVQSAIRDFVDGIQRRRAYSADSGFYFDELARIGRNGYVNAHAD